MERQPEHGGEHPEEDQSQRAAGAERRGEQRFYFGPWVFDIDRAQALIAERARPTLHLPVAAWARAYGFAPPADDNRHSISLIAPGPDFDRDYAMTTDLTEPVILATLRSSETNRVAPLLIDGTHRLYHAYVEGVDLLPAHLLNAEETSMIREDYF